MVQAKEEINSNELQNLNVFEKHMSLLTNRIDTSDVIVI